MVGILIVLGCIVLLYAASKKPGLLYLLVLPIVIITLPLKMAGDILKAERRSRNKRKGRRR